MTKNVKFSNENSILLRDKKLIVLKAAIDYCYNNEEERVRYLRLKYLSNEILSNLTVGKFTDFGGNFEEMIKVLEGRNGKEAFLKREKHGSRTTFILPEIQKINKLFEKKGLNFPYDKDISKYLPDVNIGETPRGYAGLYRISNPTDEIQVYRDWIHFAEKIQIYKSQFWDVSLFRLDKSFDLEDNQISEILELGKKISSNDLSAPFKLVIEYRPQPFSVSYLGQELETFNQ
jgi:hypothetical protein